MKPITKKLDHALLEAQGQQGALQMSLVEKDTTHDRAPQVRSSQIGAFQVSIGQIGLLQVSVLQPCPAQRGFFEVCSLQTSTLQIRPAEIGLRQVSIIQNLWWDLARKSIAQNKSYNN